MDVYALVRELWIAAGFPEYALGDDGYPIPGIVIRIFRERMTYTDANGKGKSWTQADLARRMGLSEVTIRLMETQDATLDSITRRRLVADILKIPYVFLGLGTLEHLAEFLKTLPETPSAVPMPEAITGEYIGKETIALYRDAAGVYWEQHYIGTAQGAIDEIQRWINRLRADTEKVSSNQKHELQEIECSFHHLLIKIYDDLCFHGQGLAQVSQAMELALALQSDELLAATHYRAGYLNFGQRNFQAAKANFDAAVSLSGKVCPQLRGAILSATGLAYALIAQDESDKTLALKYLDQAGDIVYRGQLEDDGHFIKLSVGKYGIDRVDALVSMKRFGAALRAADEAERGIPQNHTRRHAYLDILRAEAFIRSQTRPRYDIATDLLLKSFAISKDINSHFNITYIARLYNLLAKTTYANAPKVRDLGLALMEWNQAQRLLPSLS